MPDPNPNNLAKRGLSSREVADLTSDLTPGRFSKLRSEDNKQFAQDLLSHDQIVETPKSLDTSLNPEAPENISGILECNQKIYDFLGLTNPDGTKIDLDQELSSDNILFPTPEQQEQAEELGYTLALILPGKLDRQTVLNTITQKYASEFSKPNDPSMGLKLFSPADKDLNATVSVLSKQTPNPVRPNSFYLIYLKPDLNCQTAHPETTGKSAQDCQKELDKLKQQNPDLNLKGLTLEEYLLLDIYHYTTTQQHLDSSTWSWLLEDTFNDPNTNQLMRCLYSCWALVDRWLNVGSDSVSYAGSGGGARFACLPKPEGQR